MLGKGKIAEVLARAGLHLGATTAGRILKEPQAPEPTEHPTKSTTRCTPPTVGRGSSREPGGREGRPARHPRRWWRPSLEYASGWRWSSSPAGSTSRSSTSSVPH